MSLSPESFTMSRMTEPATSPRPLLGIAPQEQRKFGEVRAG